LIKATKEALLASMSLKVGFHNYLKEFFNQSRVKYQLNFIKMIMNLWIISPKEVRLLLSTERASSRILQPRKDMDSVQALRYPADLFPDAHQAQIQDTLDKIKEPMKDRELFPDELWSKEMSIQAQTVMSLISVKTTNLNLKLFRGCIKQRNQKITGKRI
jgi:hypothetical protein